MKSIEERRAAMRALLGEREVEMIVMMYQRRARRIADHYNESKGEPNVAR